jgi:hypothetical protein
LEFQKVIAGLSTVHVILHVALFEFSQEMAVFTRAIGTESDGERSCLFRSIVDFLTAHFISLLC